MWRQGRPVEVRNRQEQLLCVVLRGGVVSNRFKINLI